MKTISTENHSYSELSDSAKEAAIQNLITQKSEDPYEVDGTSEECLDSLKAIAEAFNVNIIDYSFGPYSQGNKVKIDDWNDHEDSLNTLLRVLIQGGYETHKDLSKMAEKENFPGHCPFTGVCYDEDIIESITKSIIIDGNDLRTAFDQVGDLIRKILEKEIEYAQCEEYIKEELDEDEEMFLSDGEIY